MRCRFYAVAILLGAAACTFDATSIAVAPTQVEPAERSVAPPAAAMTAATPVGRGEVADHHPAGGSGAKST